MSIYRRVATIFLGIIGVSPIVWVLVASGSQTSVWKIVAHIALLLIASASPVMVGNVGVSLIFPVLFPAIISMPPAAAGLVGAIGSIQRVKRLSDIDLVIVNRAIVGLPTFVASLVYHAMSGNSDTWSIRSIAAMIACAYLYTILNNLFVIVVVKIQSWKQELRALSIMVNNIRSFTFSLFLGLVMAFVYSVSEVLFVLLVILFYFNREAFYAIIINQNLYVQIINAMVKVIENVDPYTKGHSERVAAYCQAIGRAIGLRPIELNELHLIAMLHDLGKQSVPPEILRKKGRLTDDEYPLVKKHSEKGAEMLSGISLFSANRLRTISEHHERWDGRGYPKGLAGDEIDPWARIIAVADAFDAMTTDRPYRPMMNPESALLELQRNAGTQFDPRIVSVFVSVFNTPAVQEALRSRVSIAPPDEAHKEAAAASETPDPPSSAVCSEDGSSPGNPRA